VDQKIILYIDDKNNVSKVKISLNLNPNIFLLKLSPGISPRVLDSLEDYDAIVIESFGVGGLPEYDGDGGFTKALTRFQQMGKCIALTTQVENEGSDMIIYTVGNSLKHDIGIIESYDMTLESVMTKLMWILAKTKKQKEIEKLFYTEIHHDILYR